jgi:hypothetical protein
VIAPLLLLAIVAIAWLWRQVLVDHRANRRHRPREPYGLGNQDFTDLIRHCGPLPPHRPQTQEDSCLPPKSRIS